MKEVEPRLKGGKVWTGKCRLSFPHIFEKSSYQGQEGKYDITLLIPKKEGKETAQFILQAAQEAADEGATKHKWNPKTLKAVKDSLKDKLIRNGDEKFMSDGETPYDGYPKHWYVKANNNTPPQVLDARGEVITRKEDVYAGCYVRATLTFFPYDTMGNKGVGISLGNVQKLAEGQPFGNRSNAVDDFDAVESAADFDGGGSSDDDDDFDI